MAQAGINDGPCEATPREELLRQILDSRIAKNEREWCAAREIESLRNQLKDALSGNCANTEKPLEFILQDGAGNTRRGDWIQTEPSCTMFWPLDPRPEEIHIEDIAQALSMQCRFGGHVQKFYSVAEHCVLVASILPHKKRRAGLLHDASEAYCVDVPRPLKRCLAGYTEIEARIQRAICKRFGLDVVDHEKDGSLLRPWLTAFDDPEIHTADTEMLLLERMELKGPEPAPWRIVGSPAEGIRLKCWTPEEARCHFLSMFRAYAP